MHTLLLHTSKVHRYEYHIGHYPTVQIHSLLTVHQFLSLFSLIREGGDTMWKSHERRGWGINNKRAAWGESRCTVPAAGRGFAACKGPAQAAPCVLRFLNICNEQHDRAPCHHRWGCGSRLCVGTISPHHHHWSSCCCGKWVSWVGWHRMTYKIKRLWQAWIERYHMIVSCSPFYLFQVMYIRKKRR